MSAEKHSKVVGALEETVDKQKTKIEDLEKTIADQQRQLLKVKRERDGSRKELQKMKRSLSEVLGLSSLVRPDSDEDDAASEDLEVEDSAVDETQDEEEPPPPPSTAPAALQKPVVDVDVDLRVLFSGSTQLVLTKGGARVQMHSALTAKLPEAFVTGKRLRSETFETNPFRVEIAASPVRTSPARSPVGLKLTRSPQGFECK